jgi:hypothetical protein
MWQDMLKHVVGVSVSSGNIALSDQLVRGTWSLKLQHIDWKMSNKDTSLHVK